MHKDGKPGVWLEAGASKDRTFSHAFFPTPGACNDVNTLDRSPLIRKLLDGKFALSSPYSINGNEYKDGYFLTDNIYPQWAVLQKSVVLPITAKEKAYAKAQESVRKDIEW
jgi:hypothetical protein